LPRLSDRIQFGEDKVFAEVDRFDGETIVAEDEALRGVAEAAEAAGLPPIQVLAAAGQAAGAVGPAPECAAGPGVRHAWRLQRDPDGAGLPQNGRLITAPDQPSPKARPCYLSPSALLAGG
jgi:hypothetical protein